MTGVELLAVQISSPHPGGPVHSDVAPALAALLAITVSGVAAVALRMHRRWAAVAGRVVGVIGDGVDHAPLTVVEYVVSGRRYRVPALLSAVPPTDGRLVVRYARDEPAVARVTRVRPPPQR